MRRKNFVFISIFFFLIVISLIYYRFDQNITKDNNAEIQIKIGNERIYNERRSQLPSFSIHYDTHDPILIDGDLDFHSQAPINGWDLSGQRDGSSSNPYLIEGLFITSSSDPLIRISNTDVFFQVKNCLLSGGSDGIYLENVENANLSDNIISNCAYAGIYTFNSRSNIIEHNAVNTSLKGINLDSSSDNIISNNIVFNNSQVGIQLTYGMGGICDNNKIHNNTVFKNTRDGITIGNVIFISKIEKGVIQNRYRNDILKLPNHKTSGIQGIKGNEITSNTVYKNPFAGIRLSSSDSSIVSRNILYLNLISLSNTANNTIEYNVIQKFNFGIFVADSDENTISKNTISNMSMEGISVLRSDTNTISKNSIYNCSQIGINIRENSDDNQISCNNIIDNAIIDGTYYRGITLRSESSNTKVRNNNFIGNCPDKTSQAQDDSSNSVFSQNYWYEWVSPDEDSDGIVDLPYAIDGTAGNQDLHPKIIFECQPECSSCPSWSFPVLLLSITIITPIRKLKRK